MATASHEKLFKSRSEAASKLAQELMFLRGQKPLILAIPRGAVAMGRTIANELEGDLDIVLVKKIGHPNQPEYAIGSVNESGQVFITDQESAKYFGENVIHDLAVKETQHLHKKRKLYTPYRSALEVRGRICVIVDDGIATGSTFRAAIRTLQDGNAARIIVAAPVASRSAMELLRKEGVELCVLNIPTNFFSVSTHYQRFDQVDDSAVISLLKNELEEAKITLPDGKHLDAFLKIPKRAKGLVIFAHGSGSGRFSSRNRYVASTLNGNGWATLLADLLTVEESSNRDLIYDIDLLAVRLCHLVKWASEDSGLHRLPIFLFGASTGAGAAIKAATMSSHEIKGVISRGGRVDLADVELESLHCPVLLVVGALDAMVLDLNREAMAHMRPEETELAVVENASHLFEEPGALKKVSELAIQWLDVQFRSCAEFEKSDSHNEKEIFNHQS